MTSVASLRSAERTPSRRTDASESPFARPLLSSLGLPAGLLIVVLAAWGLLQPTHLVFGATVGVPVAVLGLGLLVLQGWMREISLVSAALYATSMYYFNWLHRPHQGLGLPWPVAAAATVLIPTVLMTVVGYLTRRLPSIYLIILTIGLQITLEGTVFNVGYLSGGISGGTGIDAPLEDPRPAWLASDVHFYFFALAWLGIVLAALVRLRRSRFGLALYLSGANRQAAAAVGIPAIKVRVLAFTIAGALAGVAGVLGSMFYVSPPMFFPFRVQESLVLLALPVLAGVDSMGTILVVALLLKLSPIWLSSWHLDQNYLTSFALGFGALFGARGLGGRIRDAYRTRIHGNRRERTRARRLATEALRTADGLADQAFTPLHRADRYRCVQTLKDWLPPHAATGTVASTDNLQLTFGPVNALTGATIEVPAGTIVGLIGPNGAGKTTLFDVISGFQKADTGTVTLFDTDASATTSWQRARLGLSRTFQTSRVIDELCVGDNILAGCWTRTHASALALMAGMPSAWQEMRRAEETARAAAQLLDIERYWDERVITLEYSARRRVEIARALMAGPRLLLLDEPAAGLDPAASAILFSLIKELNRDLGLPVLLVEHYVKVVLDTCDIVYVLAEGQVLAAGPPAQVMANPTVREHYLGAVNAASWRPATAEEGTHA
jgi:ABC-type branched-subunit amino acid transport system ATPase component/ABC-type branched-subunit amino acid transport system permease subunit